ncbi:MAG: serpin family protein [Myxococcota bacterium]|nr:serpin family protein [Myxococcota bacterium]
MERPLRPTTLALALLLGACGSQSAESTEPPAAPAEEPTAAPEPEAPPQEPAVTDAASAAFAASTRQFGVDFYQRLREREGNLVMSPGSIDIAFAMTWAGARGETAEQMSRVFHFGGDADALHAAAQAQLARWNDQDRDTYELRVANRLFAKAGMDLQPDFVTLTRDRYQAPVELLSFTPPDAARVHINEWVAGQTNDRIDELLPEGSIDELSRLVLTNAVYFLGNWATQFDEDQTRDEPFHVDGGDGVAVPMMHMTHTLGYAERDGVALLEMPYAGGDLAMVVVLPEARDGLGAVEEGLTAAQLEAWTTGLPEQQVQVTLPRFRIEMDAPIAMKPTLIEMGMPLPFTPAADFSAMSNPASADDQLYIDDAYHRAFIDVNESGTEAAAATAVVMRVRGAAAAPPEPPRFTADHPFLFLIRDTQTGSILFMGRVNDPRT